MNINLQEIKNYFPEFEVMALKHEYSVNDLYILEGKEKLFLKIYKNKDRFFRELIVLEYLNSLQVNLGPILYESNIISGYHFILTSFLDGKNAQMDISDGRELKLNAFEGVCEKLQILHSCVLTPLFIEEVTNLPGTDIFADFQKKMDFINGSMSEFSTKVKDHLNYNYNCINEWLNNEFSSDKWVLIHGDLGWRNILIQPGSGEIALIDFEYSNLSLWQLDFCKILDDPDQKEMAAILNNNLTSKMSEQEIRLTVTYGRIGLIYFFLKFNMQDDLRLIIKKLC